MRGQQLLSLSTWLLTGVIVSPSSFTWLDYAEQDRRKMLDVVELFADHDVRDELGLGSIRDAFADLFFPGTGTMQTRARYFLFIPWMYLKYEKKETKPQEITRKAREDEISLIRALKKAGETVGVIGWRSERKLVRLASSIYWSGLGTWGIRLCPYSQPQYHRSLRYYYQALGALPACEDESGVVASCSNWHSGMPAAPSGLPWQADFTLTRTEAEYLRERVLTSCPGTLLATLVDLGSADATAAFAWQHAARSSFSPVLQEQLDHAELCSQVMHGSSLLYNLMLAERSEDNNAVADYVDHLAEWSEALSPFAQRLAEWDLDRFWFVARSRGARIPSSTQVFVRDWITRTQALPTPADVTHDLVCRNMIREREWRIKRNQARLYSEKTLKMWSGAAGASQLNFRWPVARQIVADIIEGLNGGDPDA